jgi:hypothetical protein
LNFEQKENAKEEENIRGRDYELQCGLKTVHIAKLFRAVASDHLYSFTGRSREQGPGMFQEALASDRLLTRTWWHDNAGDNTAGMHALPTDGLQHALAPAV